MGLTIEQQRARALAEARMRSAAAEQAQSAELQEQTFRQAGIERQLGAPFDPRAGAEGFSQQFRLGFAVSQPGRMARLEQMYPGADIRSIEVPPREGSGSQAPSEMTVFRPEGEEAFRGIYGGDVGIPGLMGRGLSAVVNPEVAGAIGGAVATRGMGFVPRIAGQVAGSALGRGTQEGVEGLLGYNPDDAQEIMGRMALSGLLGGAGEVASVPLQRGISAMTPRSGMLRPSPGTQQALQAIREEELPGATMGQLHPLLMRRENQLVATTEPIRLARGEQLGAVRQAEQELAERLAPTGVSPGMSMRDLDVTVDALGDDLRRAVTNPNTSMTQGGTGLQRGLEQFREASGALVSNKYQNALQYADEASFDLSPAMESIAAIRRGTQMQGAIPGQSPVIDPSTGQPFPTMQPVAIRAEGGIHSDLRSIMSDLEVLNNAPQEGIEAAEGLIAIRGRLRRILDQNWTMADAQTRSAMKEGQSLYSALTEVMENASSPNSTFSALWKSANNTNRWKEGILSTADARTIAEAESPEALMRFASPGNFTTLRTLKRVMPEEQFQQFQNGYKTELMSAPENINRTLDAWRKDPDGLRLLLSPGDEQALRTYGQGFEQLYRFRNVLQNQKNDGERMMAFFDTATPEQAQALLRQSGGPDSRQGKQLRAGVVQAILERTEKFDQATGRYVSDPTKVGVIEGYLKNPTVAAFLQPTERRNLENLVRALRLYGGSGASDVGASMSGASTAGAAFDVSKGIPGTAWMKQLVAAGNARIFTMEDASKILYGTGGVPTESTALRALASSLFLVGKELQDLEGSAFGAGD
jgi:hypothetical protein